MGISSDVNIFCLSVILIFLIFLVVKYIQNLLSDSSNFWNRLGKNFLEKPDDDFLISVVYTCDGSIRKIVDQLKSIQLLYKQNFQLDKKLEIIVFYDYRHEGASDIKLLGKVFPNLKLLTIDLNNSKKPSPKIFLIAALAARGKYIVDYKTFGDEIDKLLQKPDNYISLFKESNKFYFSAISKSSFEYMSLIHFINTIPAEEFIIIAKKLSISFSVLDKRKSKSVSAFSGLYTNMLVNIAEFCYKNKIWKLPQEYNKSEKIKKN